MLETKSIKVQGILKEIHEKVQQKSGRFEKISEDIVFENLTLQALCANLHMSPATCADFVQNNYDCSCSVDDMIRIYRDFKINTEEKRLEVFENATGVAILLEKSMNGDQQAYELYRSTREKFMEKSLSITIKFFWL